MTEPLASTNTIIAEWKLWVNKNQLVQSVCPKAVCFVLTFRSSRFIIHFFLCRKDEGFEKLVESYIRNRLLIDLYKAGNGIKKLPHLHKLVQSATADLQKYAYAFFYYISYLSTLIHPKLDVLSF